MGWSEREKRLGLLLALCIVVLMSLVLYMHFGRDEPPLATFPAHEETEVVSLAAGHGEAAVTVAETPDEPPVVVDVKGAVHHPGVYTLPAGSRVVDAVERAGGFLAEADPERINLAQPLTDGMAFRVPFQGEEVGPTGNGAPMISTVGESGGSTKININTATASELDTLPGIGPAKAAAIIQYRTEHGPFQHVDELLEVPGIGEKTLQNLRDLITVH